MSVTITSTNNEKTFENKAIITIGSNPEGDYVLNTNTDVVLMLQFDPQNNRYILFNKNNNPNILFKGQPIGQKAVITRHCKLSIANSNEFIAIKVSEVVPQSSAQALPPVQQPVMPQPTVQQQPQQVQTRQVTSQTAAPTSREAAEKAELESKRVTIIKQVGFAVSDLKKRISLNSKASIFMHVALFFASLVTAFAVSNFLTGLQIEESKNFINLPMNIKILMTFAVIIFGLALVLKQGVFLFLQNKVVNNPASIIAQNFMIAGSSLFFVGVYAINMMYYMNINPIFAVLVALFFVGLTVITSAASGYFKHTGHQMSFELDKYEYREDFEMVMNDYRSWIERHINLMSNSKIQNIKDSLFNLQLKSIGEIVLGIITAPFLAYGVSNTLASCFPEAAGWIRVSGLRFSPVFLVLASFLIIFAFFAFVNAFLSNKKIQGSDVIKQDGFSNYATHGVDILGIQGVRKLESDKLHSLAIGCSIIFIEFTMNTSYFFTEIGGDLQGILLSIIAALVPTALLIAETNMLSHTKFDMYTREELLSKIDR